MEIRLVYTMPRMQEKHLQCAATDHDPILHGLAVIILVICQFTVIPMVVMIAADVPPVVVAARSDIGPAKLNTTTVFKGTLALKP